MRTISSSSSLASSSCFDCSSCSISSLCFLTSDDVFCWAWCWSRSVAASFFFIIFTVIVFFNSAFASSRRSVDASYKHTCKSTHQLDTTLTGTDRYTHSGYSAVVHLWLKHSIVTTAISTVHIRMHITNNSVDILEPLLTSVITYQ